MKITYPKNCNKLHSRLEEVLNRVYAKRPLLEYNVYATTGETQEATAVEVYQDGQRIGKLNAKCRRFSPAKGEHETWFAIESHTIKKQRGAEHTKYCKDAKTAARIAIESFTKKSLADLGAALARETVSNVTHIVERLHYEYTSAINYGSLSQVSTYFLDVIAGKNPPIPQKIHDQIINKDLARIKDNQDIGENILKHMKNANGYAIRVMQDESLLFTHIGYADTTSKHASTYELDQYTQEKYTMLKLLDKNQCAADIGVKFESVIDNESTMVYFIVAGETVTH